MAIMNDDTQTLERTRPNKKVWVLKIEQPCCNPLILPTRESLVGYMHPGEDFGITLDYALEGDFKPGTVLFTVSVVQMDEQEFQNLPEWDGC